MIEKIVSGGQTGADRAALDFAIERGIPHGGWCPLGRLAEDGVIAPRYELKETPSPDPAQRTEWNVCDSDGTVIFSISRVLTGGSKFTEECAARHRKPCLHLSEEVDGLAAGWRLAAFVKKHASRCLNVAGPRASIEPQTAAFVRRVLTEFFDAVEKRAD